MAKTKYSLVVDEITMGDMLVFEKATGSRIVEAISPRVIKDEETGKPVMVPDPENEGRSRPLKVVNMTTVEMIGTILIARRQADRANEKQWIDLDKVLGEKLTGIEVDIDWGDVVEDAADADPTEPAEAGTETS